MRINVHDYYTEEEWKLFRSTADKMETPCLLVNLNIVKKKYEELKEYFPFAKIYFAVKANPAPEILELLRDLGACFDIA